MKMGGTELHSCSMEPSRFDAERRKRMKELRMKVRRRMS